MAELVYTPIIGALLGSFKVLGLRLDVEGSENIPPTGGLVLASNHIGYTDFIFVGLGARPAGRHVRFMAKEAVFKNPVAGPLMRGMKHISVNRDAGAESFRNAVEALKAGEAVGVFPEATMSRSFEIKDFKSGAARMARSAKVPLIPVAVWGTQRMATYDKRSSLMQRKLPIVVRVGPAVDQSGTADEINERLREAMKTQLNLARAAYPDDGTGQWWQPLALGGSAPSLEEAQVQHDEFVAKRAARKANKKKAAS